MYLAAVAKWTWGARIIPNATYGSPGFFFPFFLCPAVRRFLDIRESVTAADKKEKKKKSNVSNEVRSVRVVLVQNVPPRCRRIQQIQVSTMGSASK